MLAWELLRRVWSSDSGSSWARTSRPGGAARDLNQATTVDSAGASRNPSSLERHRWGSLARLAGENVVLALRYWPALPQMAHRVWWGVNGVWSHGPKDVTELVVCAAGRNISSSARGSHDTSTSKAKGDPRCEDDRPVPIPRLLFTQRNHHSVSGRDPAHPVSIWQPILQHAARRPSEALVLSCALVAQPPRNTSTLRLPDQVPRFWGTQSEKLVRRFPCHSLCIARHTTSQVHRRNTHSLVGA